jgi:hypothetical protein
MSRNAYMGADEVAALVGAWQEIVGATVTLGPAPQRGTYRPFRRHHHHHHHHQQPQYAPPQAPYYPPPYGALPPAVVVAPTRPTYTRTPSYAPPMVVRDHRQHAAVRGLPWWGVPAGAAALLAYGMKNPAPRASLGAWQQIVGADAEGQALGFPPRNALVDARGPTRAGREVLPMSTGVAILPSQSAQITARPQRVAFRPERVFVSNAGTSGGAADWIVNDIKIGNRSQFSQSGDIPGDMFATNAIDGFVSFETAQTAMDVVMVVTYIGTNESGAAFYASIVGTAAI